MKYLSPEEEIKYFNELVTYCNNLLELSKEQRDTILIDYALYSRENITQEWFNVLTIVKSIGNQGECNTVIKWNDILLKNTSTEQIKPKKGTHGIPIIVPDIKKAINVKTNTDEISLKWHKVTVFPLNLIAVPSNVKTPSPISMFEYIYNLGYNEKLDEPVSIANMVDWIDIDKYINVFLNDLIEQKYAGFLNEYTKKEMHFFFELIKYTFIYFSDFYDSDDIQELDLDIPNIAKLKRHNLLLVFHDICILIRRFTSFLANTFYKYVEQQIVLQEKRKIHERMNMNIKQRIAITKERVEKGEI